MLYDITLNVSYTYDYPVQSSRQIVRLLPADLEGEQRQIAGILDVDPKPAEWRIHTDFFGNNAAELVFYDAHEDVEFSVKSRVERFERAAHNGDLSFDQLKADITNHRSLGPWSPHHFIGATSRVPLDRATTDYARKAQGDETQVIAAIIAIARAIKRDFKFDPKATTVETPLLKAFHGRRGVCQDFSHIMIACLRGIGIPAAYVSGYLRTIPPPGKKRIQGADAMHAWVRAWCGASVGWIEYDPTNAMYAGADHVIIARGRDYADVAPIKGVLRSQGEHTSTQKVDVIPVNA
ncbi:transglutaminase family protein [Aestuariivirga litoralis]|uniref:transglutaminase family protein n=1 Tax=Aestuariivirga litoralis TaxID=2650924 RepID=UPI0018C6483F|nr:transglutaminase family protein [Aestuariivirga litoralis]MBG1232365.1 transglutaminase family protein [Aestuariivirga litoralis]